MILKAVRYPVDNDWFYQAWNKGDDALKTLGAVSKGQGELWFETVIVAGSESSESTGGWSFVPSVVGGRSSFSEGAGAYVVAPFMREDRLAAGSTTRGMLRTTCTCCPLTRP